MKLASFLTALGLAASPIASSGQGIVKSHADHKTLTNVEKTDQLGLGLQVGNLSGVNFEYWVSNQRTINAAILGENRNVAVGLSYAWFARNMFSGEFNQFAPFVGLGLIGASGSRTNVFKRGDEEDFALAAQVPVGIQFLPRLRRFALYIQMTPSLQVTPSAFGFLTGDVGGRYYF